MLQRKAGPFGTSLGVSTGWILRDKLLRSGVQMVSGASYQCIDDFGLHICVDGEPRTIAVDSVVVCAGQESERSLADELRALVPGKSVHVIGGADVAAELDARRAIDQATRLALEV
jgi:2,4-dienoyl-CoA reductase (NADPH2)